MAIEMSNDHKPELPEERSRIEKAGGFVDDNRVKGVLSLSRALGDLEYKNDSSLAPKDYMITAVPDVRRENVSNADETPFLIIACDGIWDCLTSQEATELVDSLITKKDKVSQVVEVMFDKILAPDIASSGGIGCDNMTCIVI